MRAEERDCGRSAEGRCFDSWLIPQPIHATGLTECNFTSGFIRIQKIREDEENLYFNAKSLWRWCEFAAHPRVMLYADRTGAELTDIRVREELLGGREELLAEPELVGASVVSFPL